jgi:hypothetical protein
MSNPNPGQNAGEPRGGPIEDDLEAALDQVEQALTANVTNPILRDLGIHLVESLRKLAQAHVQV